MAQPQRFGGVSIQTLWVGEEIENFQVRIRFMPVQDCRYLQSEDGSRQPSPLPSLGPLLSTEYSVLSGASFSVGRGQASCNELVHTQLCETRTTTEARLTCLHRRYWQVGLGITHGVDSNVTLPDLLPDL